MFTPMSLKDRQAVVASARGERPFDLLIRNALLANVFTCELVPSDIGITCGRFAYVGPAGLDRLEGRRDVDAAGLVAAPGLIDVHLHIESSMVTPARYAEGVLRHGTTTVIIDPHEIGNVMGKEGVRLMLEGSEGLPLRVLVAVPSCVPAVLGAETTGARFDPEDIAEMLAWPRVISVAEVMDFVGVSRGNERMLGIIEAGAKAGKTIQGHAPAVVGRTLQAYMAAGVENDHELRGGAEALEKLRLGLLPFVKLGSHSNHLPAVMPELLTAKHVDIALCTDDVAPGDLVNVGHMNRVVREVIKYGVEPARALRWASLIGATHYNLRDLGAIAPGRVADFTLYDGPESLRAVDVYVGGRQIVAGGALMRRIPDPLAGRVTANSVKLNPLTEADFRLAAPIADGTVTANVMALQKNRTTKLETAEIPVRGGAVDLAKLPEDICLIAVVPRHGQTHKPSLSLIRGTGLTVGAYGHTVAHDSHNLLVYGKNAADLLATCLRLQEIGGGFVLSRDGAMVEEVPLPLAGLMSYETVETMTAQATALNNAAYAMGIRPHATPPIVVGTGLALPVVPAVRITDLYPLMDVATQEPIPLFPDAA